MSRRQALITGILVLAALVTVGVALSHDYGVTWDFRQSAFYGERYLRYFATFDARYLDFAHRAIEFSPSHPDFEPGADGNPPGVSAPNFIWPLPCTLAAAGCLLFHMQWPLLDFHAAHHLVDFVLAAALATAMILVAARRLSLPAGIAAAVLLALHPAWFGHLFNNLRDIPVACFIGLSLLALPAFVERGSRAALVAYTLCLGAGLACKITAMFVPVIGLVYALFAIPAGARVRRLVGLVLASAASLIVFVALWPWLWGSIAFRLAQHYQFLRQEIGLSSRPDLTPLLEALFTMPPITLVLGAIGIAALGRDRARRGLFLLLLAWLLVPLARICFPRARNYGGIRHFIEFLPAFALFAGVGFAALCRALRRAWPRLVPAAALLAIPALAPVVLAHPFETSYYSFLCGGVGGARKLGLVGAYDFWGNSLRQGIDWLRRHAPPQSSVIVPLGAQILATVRGVWLPEDLTIFAEGSAECAKLETLSAGRVGRVYLLALTRGPGDHEDKMPWLTAAHPGTEILRCEIDGQPLLELRDLGTHAEAKPVIDGLRAAHERELRAALGQLRATALARPDVASITDYFVALRGLDGEKVALQKLRRTMEEVLPRIEDPVLREKLQRMLRELELKDEKGPK